MCARSSFRLSSVLALALFCSALATLWAEDQGTQMSPPSAESTSVESLSLTQSWLIFDRAWPTLKNELMASSEDSERLSSQLGALQTEAEELRSSLTRSTAQLEASEAAREAERQAAAKAIEAFIRKAAQQEKRADRWRIGAIAGWAAAAVLGGVAAVQAVF